MKQQKSDHFSFLFKEHPTPMWIVAKDDFAILDVNRATLRLLEKRRSEFLRTTLKKLFPSDWESMRKLLKKKTKGYYSLGLLNYGKSLALDARCKHVMCNNKACIIIVAHEIPSLHKTLGPEQSVKQTELSSVMINSLPGVFYLFDENGKFLRWNKNFETVTGYSPEEISNMVPTDFFEGHDKELIFERISKVFVEGNAQAIADFSTKHKTKIPYHFNGWLIDYEGKRCLIGMGIDITKLRESENEREELLKRFEKISDNIPGFIYEFRMGKNGATHFPFSSKGVKQIYGLTPDCIKADSTSLFSRIHPDDIDRVRLDVQRSADKLTAHEIEFRVNTPAGKATWVRTNATIEPQADGSLIWYGYTEDITERKRMEQNLAKGESHLRTILQAEPECVKLLDDTCRLIDMNPAGLAMIEADCLDHVKGACVIDLIKPDYQAAFIELNKNAFKGEHGKLTFEIIGLKGTQRWLESNVVPLIDGAGSITAALGVTRDVTEYKLYEAELLASNTEKDILIKEIHHRVKNNLQLISSMLYLKMLEWNNPESREFMTSIREKIKSVSLIHERLLQTESLNSIDIQEYLQRLLHDIQVTYHRQDLTLSIQTDIEPITFSTDYATSLGQLVNELVINAMKHAFVRTNSGKIIISLTRFNDDFKLIIQDDGIGLPPELDPVTAKSYGMQLVQLFLKQLKGALSISRDAGTTYCIDFSI